MSEHFDTLVIGGGQAGLATSYHLSLQQRSHLVLERGDIPAPVWRDDRWDSFTLVTPNWDFRLPGAPYTGEAPDGFMPREDIVGTFKDYVERFQLPLRCRTEVTAVEADPLGFRVSTGDGVSYTARNVVMATGLFQFPRRHGMADKLSPSVAQIHSGLYRNPDALAPGGVLVVGSSQSGCQIADELNRAGRKVFLCVGPHTRAPRRYRGKDIFEWMKLSGLADQTVDTLSSPKLKFAPNPIMAGRPDGSMNLHQFAKAGIRLLGTLQDMDGTEISLAPDMHDNLAVADRFEAGLLRQIDQLVAMRQLDLPEESLPAGDEGFAQSQPDRIDLAAEGITTVIWATGYGFDFSLVRFPVFDEDGYPQQKRGVTAQEGLYFIGLPWLHNKRSGLLSGVGEDAAYVAEHIRARDLNGETASE
ncbi:MAG: NAD(P)-binding domain-containing protein [Proteobacteria bacterium]|nr:NAD(P)-binding domain-containing protein [Pseudomonadota bacterium]